jgi:hypothetical protein
MSIFCYRQRVKTGAAAIPLVSLSPDGLELEKAYIPFIQELMSLRSQNLQPLISRLLNPYKTELWDCPSEKMIQPVSSPYM